MFLSGSFLSAKDNEPVQSKVSIKKRNYDAIGKVIGKMGCKLAWAQLFVGEDGTLHTIKCKALY
jgi:hypothetical protein